MTAHNARWRRLLPALMVVGLLAAAFPHAARAASPVSRGVPAAFFLDGHRMSAPLETFVDQGALLVPARTVMEALGFQIRWDEGNGQVSFSRHGTRAAFRVGVSGVVVNGEFVALPAAPQIRSDRTYIPLALLQAAGEKIYWDSGQRAVTARRQHMVPTAAVEEVTGSVMISRPGGGPGRPAVAGDGLRPGDMIEVASGASARVGLDDGSLVEVAPGSRLEVKELAAGSGDASRKVSFKLPGGRVFIRASKLIDKNSRFELETPTGVVGVRGTMFLVEVDPIGRSVAAVVSGKVAVTSGSGEQRQTVLLEEKQETVVASADAPPEAPKLLKAITVDSWVEKAVEKAVLRHAEDALAPEIRTLDKDKVKDQVIDRLEEAQKVLERAKLRREKGDEAVPEPEPEDEKRLEPENKSAGKREERGKADGKTGGEATTPGVDGASGNRDDEKPDQKKVKDDLKPKAEQPKAEEPKAEQPRAEEPKAEQPKTEQPKTEQPKTEQLTEEYKPWPKETQGKKDEGEQGKKR